MDSETVAGGQWTVEREQWAAINVQWRLHGQWAVNSEQ